MMTRKGILTLFILSPFEHYSVEWMGGLWGEDGMLPVNYTTIYPGHNLCFPKSSTVQVMKTTFIS